jgi:isochorismate synthase EntC
VLHWPFLQGLDLLQSPKDHSEFTLVREWIKQQLSPLCTGLAVEVQKSVLKQATVQHLYGRLAGLLKRGVGDAALLAALHPTPAVCGRPREAALEYLQQHEPFDRGFYAGPFGWVTGQGAEFAVAIRSAMLPVTPAAAAAEAAAAATVAAPAAEAAGAAAVVTSKQQSVQRQLLAYAGVGVVQGSEVAAEWQELNLKVGAACCYPNLSYNDSTS